MSVFLNIYVIILKLLDLSVGLKCPKYSSRLNIMKNYAACFGSIKWRIMPIPIILAALLEWGGNSALEY